MRTRSLSNMHFGVTGIENMIISEYLVGLNEDEIKVYLYTLMRIIFINFIILKQNYRSGCNKFTTNVIF